MDIAIVTGASSALGLAISKRLIQLGFRVYGLGGDYADCPLQNVNFKPVSCDLADPAAVEQAGRRILEKEKGVYVVINNAKFFGRRHFEEMDNAEVERILQVNLLCPLVLARTFGPSLRQLQGYMIQLGAPYADYSRGGPAGAAASGGLKWMGELLFHEMRSHGVKVCHLSPEPNRVREGRTTVRPGARKEASIDPEAVAQAIEQILQSPFGNVITEMVMRPLRIEEPDQEPVRNLPYPQPQPIPYTVPREFIEAEEQLEEEKWQEDQAKKRQRRKEKRTQKKQASPEKADTPAKEAPKPKPEEKQQEPGPDAAKPRRRARRKPRPQSPTVGFVKQDPPPADKPSEKQAQPEKPAGKATRKGAARKAVKKAAKKAVKKAARKTATKAARVATRNPVKKAARTGPAKKAAGMKSGKDSA
jgi:NAD(P)-dependent dehydrogenase (short-subunit alcohol dehydrogenase family)